jgi:CheY-like chemotaxis protein
MWQRPTVHVLLVEDDDAIAAPLATGLEREGYDVARVRTGADAIAAGDVDLYLLDLGLPDLGGRPVRGPLHRARIGRAAVLEVILGKAGERERLPLHGRQLVVVLAAPVGDGRRDQHREEHEARHDEVADEQPPPHVRWCAGGSPRPGSSR